MLTKKRLSLALKFVVSGALIWLLLSNIDIDAAKARLAELAPGMVGLTLLVLFAQVVPAALRWMAVLDAIDARLPFLTAAKFFLIGAFFSQTLPSSVGGDAVRMYIARRDGMTLRGAVNGVMLERAATVVALIALVVAVQPVFLSRVDDETRRWFLPGLAVLAIVALTGLIFLMVLDRLPENWQRWRIVRGLSYLADDARRVFLAPLPLVKSVGWGMVGHVNISLAVFVLAMGLKLDVTLLDCVALVPPVILVTTLPVSIAGWGVREGAMVFFFALVGVAREDAVVLSIVLGLVVAASSLVGGLLWLLSGGTRAEVVAEAARQEAQARDYAGDRRTQDG